MTQKCRDECPHHQTQKQENLPGSTLPGRLKIGLNLSSEASGLRWRLCIAARAALGRDLAQQFINARCFFW